MSEASFRESVDSTSDLSAQECPCAGNAKSTPTVEPCCDITGQTCRATRTSGTSTEEPSQLTLSVGDSPANPSVSPAKGSRKKIHAGSGPKWPELLAYFVPAISSWRTCLGSSVADSWMSSATWPRWGMTQNGSLYQRQRVVPRTSANGSSLWGTPTARDWKDTGDLSKVPEKSLLPRQVFNREKRWPTPTARLGTARGPQAKRYFDPKRSNDLDDAVAASGVTGQLNPTWVAWLMGFPIDWLSSVPWETPSSRKSQKQSDE